MTQSIIAILFWMMTALAIPAAAATAPAPSVPAETLAARQTVPVSAMAGAADGTRQPSFLGRTGESFRQNLIVEGRWRLILNGLLTTVVISVLATALGTLLGALTCRMRMSRHRLPKAVAAIYISIVRGTPVLVILMLTYYVVFASVNLNPVFVAVIAFGLNFGAYVAEIFRTGIEGVDRGQAEAGTALGFSRAQVFFHIVMPQAARRILPVYRGEFISMFKATSVVGYIGVEDLTKASDIIRSRTFDAFFPLVMVAVIYFGATWVLGLVLDHLERRADPMARRKGAVTT
ncbi:MAG: amino acid ABC transporter permease [bacterium]